MTLIKLKTILLEKAIEGEWVREALQRTIQQAAGGTNVVKQYITKKSKELNSSFKGKSLFKEYKISQIVVFGGSNDLSLLIGITGKEGGGGIVPFKLHVFGKKWLSDKSTGKFSFTEKHWSEAKFFESDVKTKNLLVEILKATFGTSIVDTKQGTKFGKTVKWDSNDITFVTPSGEMSLNDFTGDVSDDEGEGGVKRGVASVREKDFERLSLKDLVSQIQNWGNENGSGALQDLQSQVRSIK